MTTGEKIAALRRQAGLSQEALADKIGLSRQAVSKWEADLSVPSMDNLVELAKLFGVPVDVLLRPNEPQRGENDVQRVNEPTAAAATSDKRALSRAAKWAMPLMAALLCASVLCNALALVWLRRLQQQVDAMPTGGGTVYLPAPPQTETDLTDYSVDCTYDAADDTLCFSLWAVPRAVEIGAEAQFSLQIGEQTYTADAEVDGAGYRAAMTTPPVSGDYSVLLLLSEGGRQRSMAVDTVYNPMARYRLTVDKVMLENGKVEVQVRVPSAEVWPVSGTVTVRAADGTQTSYPLDNMQNPYETLGDSPAPEGMAEPAGEATLYCRAYQVQNAQGATLEVSITDNFGRVTTHPGKT